MVTRTSRDDDAPPVRPWSERPSATDIGPVRKRSEDYAGFWDYFEAEIAPNRNQSEPEVQRGYSHLKRPR